jgi:hypothetical protein
MPDMKLWLGDSSLWTWYRLTWRNLIFFPLPENQKRAMEESGNKKER